MSDEPITTNFRRLRDRHTLLRITLNNQRNCPSRGFDVDKHLVEMQIVADEMAAELDAIDFEVANLRALRATWES